MSKKLIGMLAGVALFGSGAAFAGDDQHKKDQQAQQSQTSDSPDTMGTPTDQQPQQPATGGSGQEGEDTSSTTGTSSDTQSAAGTGGAGEQQAEGKELSGKVVWAQGQKVYVEHMGAVVELRTDSQTQFSGEATRVKDLKEGDEIRASFEVDKGIRNKALSIEKTSGTGGSGFEDVGSSTEGGLDNTGATGSETESGQGGSGLEGGASETPAEGETPPADSTLPGTGGSGTEGLGNEGETPDTMGTEPSESLPGQTGSETGSEQQPGSESEVDSSATDSSTQIQ